MRYLEFVGRVQKRAASNLDPGHAGRVTHAVLRTLGDALPPAQARELASQLPRELQGMLGAGVSEDRPHTLGEFLDRVAQREELSRSEAFDHTRAVLNVLADAVTPNELQHVRTSLPADLDTLFKPPAAAKWPDSHVRQPR